MRSIPLEVLSVSDQAFRLIARIPQPLDAAKLEREYGALVQLMIIRTNPEQLGTLE
jgi:hypothetical protein